MEYAKALPEGLLDEFRLAALEVVAHVERHGGPAEIVVNIHSRQKDTPIGWKLSVLKTFRPPC